uniref:Glutamate receptor interacting protein 2a n=1 Tax=Sparus aurata TaxID=8175 RepID=A0A671YGS6_SPAAU
MSPQCLITSPPCLPAVSSDEGPYSKGSKESGTADQSHLSQRRSFSEEYRGVTTVDLMKREGSSLGLTISGGSDKDGKPRVSNLRPGGLAARSDQLNVGDYIKSVNGINLSKLRHDEIISLLKNIGERVVLEVEYELPQFVQNPSGVITKTIEVCLHKEGNSFGFVMRGGFHEDWRRSRPLVVTYVRPGGPADREGTLKAGDRVLSIDGMPLNREKHADALTMLMQSGQEALFLIEYDVSVMEAVQQASGPLLVEIVKSPSASLGISLTTTIYRSKQVIIIDKIKPASVVERCGALHVGDILLSIDGTSTEHCSLMEATQLLASTADVVKLEILPASQSRLAPFDTCVLWLLSALVSGGFSPSSTATSGFSSQGSNTLPCPIPPIAPTSPRNSTGKRRNRKKDHKSSLSLASSSVGPGGQVFHVETSEVILRGDPLTGFGIQLQGGVFATETLSAPPVIRFIEPDSPAERCGLLQVGDRLLSINGIPTEDGTLEEAHQLLRDSALANKVTVEIEFDIAESVVPSSGTFHVKLPKRRGVELGITISGESVTPWFPLISCDPPAPVSGRTGTLEPGDRLLAIDSVRLENCTMEDAMHVLQQAEDMVKLRIQKDEDNIDELEMSGSIIYTVELKRYNGPLGITISGTEEPFDPIVISGGQEVKRAGGRRAEVIAFRSPFISDLFCFSFAESDSRHRTEDREAGFLSDPEDDLTDFHKTSKHSEVYSATVPSIDSAMSSWDSSGFDAGYGSQGTYLHKASDLLLNPNDWRRTKHRNQNSSSSTGHLHHSALYDGRYTEDDPPRCQGTLNQDDSFWSQALQDLETCGQSEILRELETNEDSMFPPEISPIKSKGLHGESKNKSILNVSIRRRDVPSPGRGDPPDLVSPTPLALHKVTIRKDRESHDFGFSVSDGLLEKGVFVNMIRPDGPADLAGLKPFDRILQVNRVRTRDLDCCLTVPLIIEAGDCLDLVISRNPLAAGDTGLPDDCDDPSNSLFCFPEHSNLSVLKWVSLDG